MKSYIIVFDNFVNGGCENLFLSIAKKRDDLIFYLIVLRNYDESQLSKLPKNVVFLNCHFKNFLFRFLYFKMYIKHNLKSTKIIIDFHEVLLSEFFVISFNRTKEKWHWFNCNPLMRLNTKAGRLYYSFFKKYDKVVCICDMQRQLLEKIVKDKNKKRYAISYNFVDQDKIINASDVLNPYSEISYIVTVARIDYGAKDFDTLISAYEKLDESKKEKFRLVIVGDGKDMPLLKERVFNSKSSKSIIIAGNHINPYPIIKGASLFILSSYTEGFPITILESFALGVPVIASNCLCGPAEILGDKYGLLFEVGNSDELSKKIELVLDNNDFANSLSKEGKKRLDYYVKAANNTIKDLL